MKKLLSLILALAMLLSVCVVAHADEITYIGYTQEEFDALEETTVVASPDSPTGYFLTFRYKDPDATRVRVFGEFMFSNPVRTSLYERNDASTEWEPGDMLLGNGWAYEEMTLNEETGVWHYTVAVPNNTYLYRFYVGGDEGTATNDVTGAFATWDPNNLPLRADYTLEGLRVGDQTSSTIYVPYDAEKQDADKDLSITAPRDGENGTIEFLTIEVADGAEKTYGLYIPYGLDLEREEPYKVLVLNHGAGGYYASWINQGGMIGTLDNCIAEGILEPTIVVTPNTSSLDDYLAALNDYVFPYLAENYNASLDPEDHAIAGLSAGASLTCQTWLTHPDMFEYYGQFSGYWLERHVETYGITDLTDERYKDLNIFFACGMYDQLSIAITSLMPTQSMMTEAGIPYQTLLLEGGHTWNVWQQAFAYFCQNVLWK